MRTFSCFMTDRRYTAPTLIFIVAPDEGAALRLVRKSLLESEHHLAVEVCEDDRELFHMLREAPELAEVA
jgi:hypothetical protein